MKHIVLLILSILVVTVLSITSLVMVKEESIKKIAVECYQEIGQCGIHSILEESKIEDESIDFNIIVLETEIDHMDDESRNKGLMILRYLRGLSNHDRQKFISSISKSVNDV